MASDARPDRSTMLGRENVSVWVALTVCSLLAAVLLDTAAWSLTGWGYAEEDTFYTRLGLWQICNGSREVTKWDKREISRSEPQCVFPTAIAQGQGRSKYLCEALCAN